MWDSKSELWLLFFIELYLELGDVFVVGPNNALN